MLIVCSDQCISRESVMRIFMYGIYYRNDFFNELDQKDYSQTSK